MSFYKNIKKQIQQGLNARLSAMSTYGQTTLKSPSLSTVSDQTEEFKLSRQALEGCSPYVRMIGGGPKESFYVISGMFNMDSDQTSFEGVDTGVNYSTTRPSTSNLTGGEGYYQLGKSQDIRDKRFGYKEPGITNVSVTNLDGGAKGGAVKQAVVQFTVWQMSQLDIFQRHSFLSLGATVVLDWGWVRPDKDVAAVIEPPSIIIKDGEKITLDYELFEEPLDSKGRPKASAFSTMSETKYGDWDGLIGVVTKCDWKINEEGAFECETTIQGKGAHAFNDPIPTKERKNSRPPMESTYTGIRDPETFRFAFYKKVKENKDLTEREKELLGVKEGETIEDVIARARSGPEVSLSERIAQLDIEILVKLFPKIGDPKPEEAEIGKDGSAVAAMSPGKEVAMIYTPFKALDEEGKETKQYAVGVLKKDEKTGELIRNTKFRYEMWINWGWFEDNVASYYGQSFGEGSVPSAEFRSVKAFRPNLGPEHTSTTIKNDPNLYTHTNNYILPGSTPENWIPEEIGDEKNRVKNVYRSLAKKINEAPQFTVTGSPNAGYLRHIYVNLNLIKSAFSNPGISISGGMLALAESLNSTIRLWNFEIGFQDKTTIESNQGEQYSIPARYFIREDTEPKESKTPEELDPGQSYIFENNGLNSLLQSCDISTDISSRYAAAAFLGRTTAMKGPVEKLLQQNSLPFADQEEIMNMAKFYTQPNEDGSFNRDPLKRILTESSIGGSDYDMNRRLYYGSQYGGNLFDSDSQTADGINIAPSMKVDGTKNTMWNHDIREDLRRLYPTSLSARVEDMDAMFKQALEQGHTDVDVSKFNPQEGVTDQFLEEIKELNMYAFPPKDAELKLAGDNKTEKNLSALFPYQGGFNMQDMWLRTLDFYLSENPVSSLLSFSRPNDVTFLPIKAQITIDGCGGLRLLDMFRLSYLPSLYKQEGDKPGSYFIIIGLENTISQDGWTTNITGQIMIDNENLREKVDISEVEEELKQAMEDSFEQIFQDATTTTPDEDNPRNKPAEQLQPLGPLPEPSADITPTEDIINNVIDPKTRTFKAEEIAPGIFRPGGEQAPSDRTSVFMGNIYTRRGHSELDFNDIFDLDPGQPGGRLEEPDY